MANWRKQAYFYCNCPDAENCPKPRHWLWGITHEACITDAKNHLTASNLHGLSAAQADRLVENLKVEYYDGTETKKQAANQSAEPNSLQSTTVGSCSGASASKSASPTACAPVNATVEETYTFDNKDALTKKLNSMAATRTPDSLVLEDCPADVRAWVHRECHRRNLRHKSHGDWESKVERRMVIRQKNT